MNLGLLIRRYRKERKFTLKTVAKKAGISEGFLSQVENNVNAPSVESLVKICNSIGVNAGDLINQAKNQERLVVIRKSEWSRHRGRGPSPSFQQAKDHPATIGNERGIE